MKWPANVTVNHPGSDDFAKTTERWSIYEAPKFSSAISPTSEQQVAEIVKAATACNIPFLATGGRHGYTTTLGKLDKGLAIDLSKLNSLSIDRAAGTITVGPGVRNGDVFGPILAAGYQMRVGLIGGTLGAGVGLYQGLFGLVIDALICVRLVTATGNIVEASALTNPELFWGIRGAGFNFGIVTSATYKLTKAVNDGRVFTADMVVPASLKSAYFDVLKTFEDQMPAEMAVNTAICWDADTNATMIISTLVYSGPESKARQVLAPFFDLNPPVIRSSVSLYSDVPSEIVFGMLLAMGAPAMVNHDSWTVNVKRFAVETLNATFDKFDAFYRANPDGRLSVALLETFSNHAVVQVPDDANAYHGRAAKGNFMIQINFPRGGDSVEQAGNDLARELRSDFAATSGFPDLSVYVSYAHGDETLEQIYGKEKLPRLAALKKQWDPENVFGFNNALPTEYP